MKKSIFLSLLILLAAFGAKVQAASVYTYLGDNYTSFTHFGFGNNAYNDTMHLSATLSLATPLAANLPLTDIAGLFASLAVNDGRTDFHFESTLFSLSVLDTLAVGTDAAGNINAWSFAGHKIGFRAPQESISSSGNANTGSDSTTFCGFPGCVVTTSSLASVNTPGAWTSAVPVPQGMALFAPALGLLVGAIRKRRDC
jgi:hypothetical protein